jgi:hypothetical protein
MAHAAVELARRFDRGVILAARRWAWAARAGDAKVMLLALAEHADATGYCYPSLRRVAAMCEVSESTARRMIKRLVLRQLVTIERRVNANGSCASNGYRLAIDPAVNLTGWGIKLTGGMVSAVAGEVVSAVKGGGVTGDRETTTEQVLYIERRPVSMRGAATPMKHVAHRRGRALCFPSGVSADEREALTKKLVGLNEDQAQEVLDELAGRMSATRIRNAVGYCARLAQQIRRGAFHLDAGVAVARRRQELRPPDDAQSVSDSEVGDIDQCNADRIPAAARATFEHIRSNHSRAQNNSLSEAGNEKAAGAQDEAD